jgi:hypothetical protein
VVDQVMNLPLDLQLVETSPMQIRPRYSHHQPRRPLLLNLQMCPRRKQHLVNLKNQHL